MARFQGDILGNQGLMTQQGSLSGLSVSLRGRNIGVRAYLRTNAEGKDELLIFRTGGSKNPAGELLGRFSAEAGEV